MTAGLLDVLFAYAWWCLLAATAVCLGILAYVLWSLARDRDAHRRIRVLLARERSDRLLLEELWEFPAREPRRLA